MPTLKVPASVKPRHYLREWREYRGLTQEELARLLRTTKGVVSRWESGERKMAYDVQFLVARKLRIFVGALFQPPPPPEMPITDGRMVADYVTRMQKADGEI